MVVEYILDQQNQILLEKSVAAKLKELHFAFLENCDTKSVAINSILKFKLKVAKYIVNYPIYDVLQKPGFEH